MEKFVICCIREDYDGEEFNVVYYTDNGLFINQRAIPNVVKTVVEARIAEKKIPVTIVEFYGIVTKKNRKGDIMAFRLNAVDLSPNNYRGEEITDL